MLITQNNKTMDDKCSMREMYNKQKKNIFIQNGKCYPMEFP